MPGCRIRRLLYPSGVGRGTGFALSNGTREGEIRSLSVPSQVARSPPLPCAACAHAYRPLILLHSSGDSDIWSTCWPLNYLFRTPSAAPERAATWPPTRCLPPTERIPTFIIIAGCVPRLLSRRVAEAPPRFLLSCSFQPTARYSPCCSCQDAVPGSEQGFVSGLGMMWNTSGIEVMLWRLNLDDGQFGYLEV